jgi:hypothetical protein
VPLAGQHDVNIPGHTMRHCKAHPVELGNFSEGPATRTVGTHGRVSHSALLLICGFWHGFAVLLFQ